MTTPRIFANLRRITFALVGIVALVAVALPTAAFAASGPVVAETSPTGLQQEGGKYNRGRPGTVYGYSYSKANQNYEKRYGNNHQPNRNYQRDYNYNNRNYGYNNYRNDNYGHKSYSNKGYDNKHQSYCENTYRVKRGDTLSKIARHYHVTVHALTRANNIHNANRIYVGQRLCIPDGYGHYR